MNIFGKTSTLLLSTFIFAAAHGGDLDLEMTGPEYAKYFDSNKEVGGRASAAINNIIVIGKRNLDWFKLINANRPANAQLALYTPELQTGIPMDKPKEYNEKTVLADYDTLKAQMPDTFKNVILGNGALPTNHPLASDTEYLDWTRKMDRVYQSASRWTIMEPNLWSLASRSYGDIRGYYFLSKIENINQQLDNWAAIPEADKTNYNLWLTLVCHNNNKEKAACHTELDRAISSNTVKAFYTRYLPASKKRFDGYFAIQGARRDVKWDSANPLLMSVPFVRPESLEIQKWLSDNIEDEWRFKVSADSEWKLKLDFVETDNGTIHLEFEPGSTPHVNGLGGNIITMDDNAPLQDYGTRWTIRHEYGHTLGFPDCYIEFYDTEREIIINYQIDLDNLMCSRKGHIQEKHYVELKSKYFH